MVDLSIGVIVFALVILLTILGINQHKRWHTVVGVIAVVLVGWQTYRQDNQLRALGSKIDNMRTLLEKPGQDIKPATPAVKLNPPASKAASQPAMPALSQSAPGPKPTDKSATEVRVAPTPQVAHVRFTTAPEVSSTDAAPYALRVVLQTDAPIQNPAFAVRCECDLVNGRLSGLPVMMNVRWGLSADRRAFLFSFSFPTFAPDAPLSIILLSKSPIRVTAIERL